MTGLVSRFPRAANICKLNFDTFDIERDRCLAGERQLDRAVRSLALRIEADGEQRQHLVTLAPIDAIRFLGVVALACACTPSREAIGALVHGLNR